MRLCWRTQFKIWKEEVWDSIEKTIWNFQNSENVTFRGPAYLFLENSFLDYKVPTVLVISSHSGPAAAVGCGFEQEANKKRHLEHHRLSIVVTRPVSPIEL
jgi:hypothetical protein